METTVNFQNRKINWIKLIMCVLGVIIIGSISGLANIGNIETWYAGLEKPSFNPPNSIFAPVWTTLYGLMGVGLYLIWYAPQSKARSQGVKVFFIQLSFNFCWSFIFFYFHQPGLAAIEIVLLWGLIVYMINRFYQVSKVAAYLQVPYLLWVSFATVLNISIWWLNH
ncbi:tryptophan-rich sensory protein [Echinicola sp. CAU 1574]|uniref:Tryptophan-rich sensory protein n=1 Tax=Echinicola arenosa TaxID=2774144 RepID=A0ABR9ALC6_9BACT|nr:TspO/MBR family protein [Echinicola arenosa]MBD8489601.1 tryptophan-rich sensory protein [Echinicola arenosa]